MPPPPTACLLLFQAVKTKWDTDAAASFGEETSSRSGFPQHGAGLPQMA